MILAGQLLKASEERRAELTPGFVRIEDEQIVEVVEGEIPTTADIGGPNALISPGFIDAHLHLPQFEMIGAHGLPLLDWLSMVTFPIERKWEDVDYARARTRRVVDELVAHGTTGICAYATVHQAATAAALEVVAERGLRGVVGQTLIERNAPDYLCRPATQLIDETANLIERFSAENRVSAAVTPRFAVTCTEQLLAEAGRLATETGAMVQTHLSETVPECEFVAQLFGGVGYVEVYRQAGLVTPQAIFGHGIYLSGDEGTALAASGALVAHCPTANSFLRSGVMNRHVQLTAGVRLVLGSDVGGGYERSMVRVGRAMIEAAAALGENYPSAAEAWWQITAGNALALGWLNAGELKAGNPADLVVIEPDVPWLDGPVDPLARLMFAWDDRWVRRTYARGELIYSAA